MKWLKKGLPAVKALGQPAKGLEFAKDDEEGDGGELETQKDDVVVETNDAAMDTNEGEGSNKEGGDVDDAAAESREADNSASMKKVVPPTEDEYIWMWKVRPTFNGPIYLIHSFIHFHSIPCVAARVGDYQEDVLPLIFSGLIRILFASDIEVA